jgi:protein-glutamine gamma-glutamyltransferase
MLDTTHRRLSAALSLAALVAFAGGAGFEPVASLAAGMVLLAVLVRPPGTALGRRLEWLLGPLAILLLVRVLAHLFVFGGDVVIPVVDLLLLLLCGEALRPPESHNEVRIYALSFALLLAATAYRPGVLFALAFVVYVILASVTVPVGLLRRKSRRFGTREVALGPGFVVTSVALSMVTLLASVLVFVAFPRVSQAGGSRGEVLARSVAGFSDQISIGEHGSVIYGNPEVVLRVEFPDGRPSNPTGLHWRGRSYDHFDGMRWTRSAGVRPSAAPTHWYEERWRGPRIRQEIYAAPLDVRVLFALHPLIELDARSGIQPMFDNVGDYSYWGGGSPAYSAVSIVGRPAPDSLRAATAGFMPDRERFLQLPRLPDRIPALADSLTRDLPSRYDRAIAVERWLRTFDYTRELPATARQATLEHFLFTRRAGHCEYFSTAMVVLLRSVGIHARNVNGFLGGRWNTMGGYLAVTQNEAHSWVEVWFPGYGWVPFDPTPGGVGAGAAQSSWFWPGRLFLDGLQHRWGKWVLDYSITEQTGALSRLSRALNGADPADRRSPGPGTPGTWIWAALLAAAVAVGLLRLRRAGPRHRGRPESREYLRLLRTVRRSGLIDERNVTPLDLARRIAAAAPGAGSDARRLIELYVEARFSSRPPDPEVRSAMAEALANVRRALR